jgi:hypothetical protein
MQAARNALEFRLLCDAGEAPFIRSRVDWDAARGRGEGVLTKCSVSAINEWEREATYKNGGLAHGSYELLSNELSEDELFEFFELFGLSRALAGDHMGYRCESTGTCTESNKKICTSNCIAA